MVYDENLMTEIIGSLAVKPYIGREHSTTIESE